MAEFPTGDAEETVSADEKIGDLRACPKCAQPISNTAPVFPHCGQSLKTRNRLAIASFVLGVLSFAGFLGWAILSTFLINTAFSCRERAAWILITLQSIPGFFVFFPLPTIILGYMAKFKIRKSPMPMKGRRLATVGLGLGYSSAFLILLGGVNAVLSGDRCQSNDSAAIGNLRTITGAQTGYKDAHGVYAGSFAELTDDTNGPAFLLGLWEDTPKSGYRFALKATDNGDCYETTASPAIPGSTDIYYLFSDCSGVIRWNEGAPANSTSPPLGKFGPPLKLFWGCHR